MKSKKVYTIALLVLLLLICSGCQLGNQAEIDTEVAVAVAMTQTAIAQVQQSQPTAEPTATPTEIPADLQPLNPDECNNLANIMGQNLGIQGQLSEGPLEDHIHQKIGTGCQAIFSTTGQEIDNFGVLEVPAKLALKNAGWHEDIQYAAGGAGGVLYGYRKANGYCQLVLSAEPSDMALCTDDEPVAVCWERLAPEQKIFKVDLNCAQGDLPEFIPPEPPSESELMRIEFEPGEASKEIKKNILPNSVDHYVFYAEADQNLDVSIYPPGVVTVVVFGNDGTVLKSDLDNVSDWSGVLPTSQDYFIDVTSIVNIENEYTLNVGVPPLEPIATTGDIAGGIFYPEDTIPALHIVAYNLESNLWYFIKAGPGTTYYVIPGLPPGQYHVAAYTQSEFVSGFFTQGTVELTPVTVIVGETSENTNFTQWYEPGSVALPADPVGW